MYLTIKVKVLMQCYIILYILLLHNITDAIMCKQHFDVEARQGGAIFNFQLLYNNASYFMMTMMMYIFLTTNYYT